MNADSTRHALANAIARHRQKAPEAASRTAMITARRSLADTLPPGPCREPASAAWMSATLSEKTILPHTTEWRQARIAGNPTAIDGISLVGHP
jgi:hypothetical protein